MYASVVTGVADPKRMDEGVRIWKESAAGGKGYKGGYMIADRKTGKFMTFNLWDDEEDARAYQTGGEFQHDVDRFASGFLSTPTREVFEVVAQK